MGHYVASVGAVWVANASVASSVFDTRSGLNANVDIPSQGGVYIVPTSFNENSTQQSINVYFNIANVGATFMSYTITDCAGTTIASG